MACIAYSRDICPKCRSRNEKKQMQTLIQNNERKLRDSDKIVGKQSFHIARCS